MSDHSDDVAPKKRKLAKDDVDTTEKKKKKSKIIESGGDVAIPEKKKKKHKKESAAAETETTSISPILEVIEDAGEQDRNKKKHKKEKKKKEAEESLTNGDAPLLDEKKKRKKEKKSSETITTKEEDNPDANADSEGAISSINATEPERKKAKKHKKDKVPADVTTSEIPKTKKQATDNTLASISSDSEVSAYLQEHNITITPFLYPPILSFSAITPSLPSSLHSAFASFTAPSPIQACTWPPLLAGRDVVGIAETGSGKTFAFGIPALSKLINDSPASKKSSGKKHSKAAAGQVRAIVLAPTRELAIQTHDALTSVLASSDTGVRSVALYGGVDKDAQRRTLQNSDGGKTTAVVVVGTPGRILDFMQEGALDLSGVTYAVLDEADRMLDKGFENDIRSILGQAGSPESRQTVMFSATWPDAVRRLASSFQRDPIRVTVGSDDLTANKRITQSVEVFDDTREKDSRLMTHLRRLGVPKGQHQHKDTSTNDASSDPLRILIFALYKKEAARLEFTLRRAGYAVSAIHGDLSQPQRIAALSAFRSGVTPLLVATDVAARGLDIPRVHTVLNYTFPLTVEDYVHRIGRTGRAGRRGEAVTFFTGEGHERALAGEFARVLREAEVEGGEGGATSKVVGLETLKERFPMTVKKKVHSVYGAHFRDDIPMDVVPTKMKFT